MAVGDVVSLMRRGLLCAGFLILCGVAGLSRSAGVTYEYDAAGRLKQTIYDDDTVVEYTLDAAGNRTSVNTTLASPLPGVLALSSPAYSVSEAGGSATVTVTRTGGTSGAVAVSYATSNGTAQAGSDYTLTSGTLNWAHGDAASKTFSVPVLQETTFEPDETLNIGLSAPTGGATLGNSSATLTIVNDDSPAPGTLQFGAVSYAPGEADGSVAITVTRANGSDGAASVNYATANGTATAGGDYTSTSGTLTWANGDASAKTFNVPLLQDTVVEGTQSFSVSLSNVSGASLGSPASTNVNIADDDNPPSGTLQFGADAYSVSEAAGSVTLTVTRVGGSTNAASISYATTGYGTAAAGSDFTHVSGTLNWANGDSTSKSFNVPILSDAVVEGSENILVELSGAVNAQAGTPSWANITITDGENPIPGTLQLSAASFSTSESSGSLTVTVTRTGGSSGAASINYGTVNGSATAGNDYTAASGTLSWANGDAANKTFNVPIASDALPEGNETFTISLSDASGAGAGSPTSATVTIADVDGTPPGAPGTPSFSGVTVSAATASWSAATDSFGVTGYRYRLNGGAWNVLGNVTSVALSSLSSYTTYSFEIQARDAAGNWSASASNSFTTLDGTAPSAPGTPGISNITTTTATASWSAASDNAAVTGYRYSLNGGSSWTNVGNELTANLTSLGIGTSYTLLVQAGDAAGNWGPSSSSSFTTLIPPTGSVQFSAPSFPVVENGGAVTITVTRTGGSYGAASVSYATSGSTATAGADFTTTSGSLSWVDGDTASKSFSVPILQDGPVEGNEAFNVSLSGASGASMGPQDTATVVISEPSTGTVQLSASSYSIAENGGALVVTVTRTGSSYGNVSVFGGTSFTGSATTGTDYDGVSGVLLSWASGDGTNKTFSIPVHPDALAEGSESFLVYLSTPLGVTIGSPASATATILDVDGTPPSAPGTPSFSSITTTSATASWTAASDSFGVTGYRYSINGGSSWTNVGNVLSANLTGLANGTSYTVLVQAGDAAGNWGASASSSFTTLNPPAGSLQFSSASYSVLENGGSVTITVTRTNGSFGEASVTYGTSGSTAAAGVDFTTTSGTLNWANGDTASKTFSIPILQDGPIEGNEVFYAGLSGATGASMGSPDLAFITITEPTAGTLQLSASSYSISENAGSLTVTATRSGGSYGNVFVFAGTSANGNATAGTDYDGVSGVLLSWANGDSSNKTFSIPVHADALAEGNETFLTYLYSPSGTTTGSPSSATVTITDVDTTAPSAPGTPWFSVITTTSATANWGAASDAFGVTGYRYRLNGGAWTEIGAVTSVGLSGLAAYTTYTLEVQARDAVGYWGPGSSGSFTTVDGTPPGAPGTPSFSSITSSSAVVSWTAATDNVGVTGYRYSLNGGSSWTTLGNVLSTNLSALSPGTSYTVLLQARDAVGSWGASSSGSFTTTSIITDYLLFEAGGTGWDLWWTNGYVRNQYGSLTPDATSNGRNINAIFSYVEIDQNYTQIVSQYTMLNVSFPSNPGADWLVSITGPGGITLTGASASFVCYSGGTQCTWQWPEAHDLGSSGTMTIIHK